MATMTETMSKQNSTQRQTQITTVKPSTPPANGRCTFWSLPSELRQMIFENTYLLEQPFDVRTRPHWRRGANKWRVSSSGFEKRPQNTRRWKMEEHPALVYASLMQLTVSRRWFDEAIEAYFRSRIWSFEHLYDLSDFLLDEGYERTRYVSSIFLVLRNETWLGCTPDLNTACPHLKSLTVRFDFGSVLSQLKSKSLPEQISEAQIARMPVVNMALSCKKLTTFRVIRNAQNQEGSKYRWNDTLQDIEAYVMGKIEERKRRRSDGYISA